jgi:hypothetical protein
MDNKMKILKTEKEIPDANFMDFSESNLEAIYDKVEEECMEAVADNKKPPNSIVIVDDCAQALKEKLNGTLSRIATQGRHINMSLIVTSQKWSLLPTVLRCNASGAILFGNSAKEADAISDDLNYLESKKDFIKLFRNTTKGRNKFLCVSFSQDDLYLDSFHKTICISIPISNQYLYKIEIIIYFLIIIKNA